MTIFNTLKPEAHSSERQTMQDHHVDPALVYALAVIVVVMAGYLLKLVEALHANGLTL